MNRGYFINLTCPRCGCDIEHVADPAPNPTFQRALFRCPSCRIRAFLAVAIQELQPELNFDEPTLAETLEWNQDAPCAGLIHLLMEAG